MNFLDELAEVAGKINLGQRGRDCAAVFVAQDDNERRVQMLDGVFDGAENERLGGNACQPQDEEISQALIEYQLRSRPRIRAREHDREGMLSLGQRGTA